MRKSIILAAVAVLWIVPSGAWFLVPMAYYDGQDSLTIYGALGFGDTTKYCAAELRYAPPSEALRAELTLRLPLVGEGTLINARYTKVTTPDPRKPSIYLADEDTTLEDLTEQVEEKYVKLSQSYKAGVSSDWGIYLKLADGQYISDYTLSESGGWEQSPETTRATYISGGLWYGHDDRGGSFDPQKGYYFNISVGGTYLVQDTLDADYVDATTHSGKLGLDLFVEQRVYVSTDNLPIQIPLLTAHAPTVMAVRTAVGYQGVKFAQGGAFRAGDLDFFRGVPPRKLAGYAFYLLAIDFRICPVKRMYTPITILHKIAPSLVPDARADIQITPFVDIGRIYGSAVDKQTYSYGGGLALKFSEVLIPRFDVAYCPQFGHFTTYFSIRHPF
ncbi:hypothetical protein J7K99_05490 [bacterium]|nr:hypothetical protein [bacterium]